MIPKQNNQKNPLIHTWWAWRNFMFQACINCDEIGLTKNLWLMYRKQFPNDEVKGDNEWFEYPNAWTNYSATQPVLLSEQNVSALPSTSSTASAPSVATSQASTLVPLAAESEVAPPDEDEEEPPAESAD